MAWLAPPGLCNNAPTATINPFVAQLGSCSKLNARGVEPRIEWMNDAYRLAGSRCDARSVEPRSS